MMAEPETNKQIQEIPSLKEFVFPSDEIKNQVDALLLYYQFSNQESVGLYEKWKGKTHFNGTIGQLRQLDEIRELLDKTDGKKWSVLLQSIFLIEHYETKVNFEGFYKLSDQQQLEVTKLISNGQKAYMKN